MADGYTEPVLSGEIPAPLSLSATIETTSPVIKVDSEITEDSTNAAQTKAVYKALQLKVDKASSMSNGDIMGIFHS